MKETTIRHGFSVALLTLAAAACAGGSDAPPPDSSALMDPSAPAMNATAPDVFRAAFGTNQGDFVIEVHRAWAPNGADRFYNLVRNGYYDDQRFFRVVPGFVVQFGIHGDPEVSQAWRQARIPDDAVTQSNTRGTVTFAMAGPDTRTTQLFINLGDNTNLDGMGFSPIGTVVEGMDVVEQLYGAYGDGAPRGPGPNQARIQTEGNAYLDADFPFLSRLARAVILSDG